MSAIRMSVEEYEARQRRLNPGLSLAAQLAKAPAPAPTARKESPIEVEFLRQLRESGMPPMVREYKPFAERNYRLDFCWPERRIAVECEGRVHRIKERWLADLERRNLLTLDGWVVLYVCREQVAEGDAIRWLAQLAGEA